jgi:PhoPQ-activated pathogenicity-related protein
MHLSFFNPAKLISPTLLNPFTLRCKKVGFLALLALSTAASSSLSAQEATAVAEPPAAERLKAMETPLNEELTALDKYVAAPDSSYKWDIVNTIEDAGGTLFVVDMKSQTWLKPEEVNRTVWQHWLMIYRPKEVTSNRAMMFISGGGNGGEAPKNLDMRVAMIAKATKTVVAELKQVPNQPLIFHGDGQPRVEDDLIAYTWNHYIKTGDERWPARLPMVKSAVRAMDTVSAVMASQQAGGLKVNEFVVAGGSKRGWTTWMTAAVDKRVIGIAPIVIDVLNVDKSMQHHYSAYGFWAPAIDDYVHHKIMDQRHEERYIELLKIEDPFAYRDRFTMPKCIINATGDQFFCPDSSQFYFDQLPGEKHLCYVPNSEHSLKDTDALDTLIAFHYAVVHNIPRPKVEWSVEKDGITVRSETKPSKVTLWQAHNSEARDFRVDTIGRAYKPEVLKENGNGIYEVKLTTPKEGWNASFIQCEYDIGGPVPLRLTTPVKVLPETLPAAP